MKRPTPSQFSAYQQAFDYFNQALFESQLPDCMLSFSRRRSSSHTLFTAEQWREKAGSAAPEISLNVKQLSEDVPIEAMATLVRQMVHLWQERNGNPSSTGYYNREWAEKMENVGLIPTATGVPGGKRTGKGIHHFIEPNGRFERAFRKMSSECFWPFLPAVFAGQKRRGGSDKVSYKCIGCGAKAWGKGGLEMVCGCGQVFAGEAGDAKQGLDEKVYRILAKRFG